MAETRPDAPGQAGRALRPLLAGLRGLACLAVLAMMSLTFVDVVRRYFFNAPLGGANEITQFLLAVTIFAALPLVTWQNGHIVVMLFEKQAQEGRIGRVIGFASAAISAAVLAFLAYLLWHEAGTLESGDVVTGFLRWPFAPLVYLLSFLTVLGLALQLAKLASRERS